MNSKLSAMINKTLDKHFGSRIKSTDKDIMDGNHTEVYSNSSSQATEGLENSYITYEQPHTNESLKGIRVENEKIIIENDSIEDNNSFSIMSCDGIKLYINGQLCERNNKYIVTPLDDITTVSEKIQGSRNITLTMSADFMEAYLDINYTPEYVYRLKDRKPATDLKLKSLKESNGFPCKFNVTEITSELGKAGIKFGLIKENIIKAVNSDSCDKLLIAKGKKAVDDKPSEVNILFEIGDKKSLNSDTNDRIDYKNVYSINNINIGQELAKIIPEIPGEDGKNIKGEVIKRKTIKSKPIKAGDGCRIEDDKIIAKRPGRPSSKNGVLSVNNVYNIEDVNMKSGNINFIGDIEINGTVSEGMKVKAGNSIVIKKDLDNAEVIAGGEINVKGNIINSKIYTGQVDIEKKEYLDLLNTYKEEVTKLVEDVKKLNESSNCTKKISDLTRILIENRFKNIPKLSLNIISKAIKLQDEDDNELIDFLRSKVMGLNISNIKTLRDLDHLVDLINEEIDYYDDDMIIQSDIYVSYLQDSLVKSTGNIFVTGKGEYVTNLIALKNIEFLQSNAVARGGLISARGNIKLGTVGSSAGVSTRIEVTNDGIITAGTAYANTVFVFGKKSKTLNEDSRNLKAYMDKDGQIIFEKLKL
ncbi:DUF342 domain-containing protein [uncultured Clostridium sp.]|uniref:DUF342 domain-containing protein n=1 Tax=uncultured Clostridium sp. TaxID=59620 RepID=UPI0025D1DFBC|nr:FapA family protein [uncultured Clostridium sp.]